MFLADAQNPQHLLDSVLAPYVGIFFVAFMTAFILTPRLRSLAVRHGIVDHPDHGRKTHLVPIAYLGGLALFLAWTAGVITSWFITPHNQGDTGAGGGVDFPISILLGAAVITVIGLIDDVYHISPRVKIGGQFLAAAFLAMEQVGIKLIVAAMEQVGYVDPPYMLCYVLGACAIALFVVGGCNAVNLLDGMDGLAAGVIAIATTGFLFIALHTAARWGHPSGDMSGADPLADPVRIAMCMAILGALLGFLPYNFNPANIFMGDAGSLLLGFLSVTTILLFAHAAARGPVLVTAALIAFALPILDTTMAIVRRVVAGRSIASADKDHLHHLIQRRGYTVRQTVMIMYSAGAACSVVAGLLVLYEIRWRYVLMIFLVMLAFAIATAIKVGQRQAALAQLADPGLSATPSA